MGDTDPAVAAGVSSTFEGTTATINSARALVDDWLVGLDASVDLRDRAALVVSELSSNAVEASPGLLYEVGIGRLGDLIRLSVTNRVSDEAPPPRGDWGPDDVLAPRGRGLAIVDMIATSVTVDRSETHRITIVATLAP